MTVKHVLILKRTLNETSHTTISFHMAHTSRKAVWFHLVHFFDRSKFSTIYDADNGGIV